MTAQIEERVLILEEHYKHIRETLTQILQRLDMFSEGKAMMCVTESQRIDRLSEEVAELRTTADRQLPLLQERIDVLSRRVAGVVSVGAAVAAGVITALIIQQIR